MGLSGKEVSEDEPCFCYSSLAKSSELRVLSSAGIGASGREASRFFSFVFVHSFLPQTF